MSDNLPAADPAVEAEISELENLMRTDRREYNRREGRYRELLAARASGDRASSRPAAEREMAEIERIMRTDRKRYDRDPEMQARYRELLGGDAPDPEPEPDEHRPGDLVPLKPLSEWSREGWDVAHYDTYRRLVGAANDVLNGAGDDAAAISTSFSSLPEAIRNTAFAELVNRTPIASEPLPEDEMQRMAENPENAAMIREWGDDAPRKFGTIRQRLYRVVDRLDESDAAAFSDWFGQLPPRAAVALMRRLAA